MCGSRLLAAFGLVMLCLGLCLVFGVVVNSFLGLRRYCFMLGGWGCAVGLGYWAWCCLIFV